MGFFPTRLDFSQFHPTSRERKPYRKKKKNLETSAYYLPGSLFTTIMHYCCSQ